MGIEYQWKHGSKRVVLVGHPFSPSGRGEDIRSTFRSLKSVDCDAKILDIYSYIEPERSQNIEFSNFMTDDLGEVNVFHINGDEVEPVIEHLKRKQDIKGYNIVYPAWELSRYPIEWLRQLERFSEIWAPSKFIYESLKGSSKTIEYVPLASEVAIGCFLGRKYFGIPETDYVFLFFFDLRSYSARKNPKGIIEAFRRLVFTRPYAKISLIIKVSGTDVDGGLVGDLRNQLKGLNGHVVIIDRVMTDNEIKNLIRNSDCFVSLHRSEGFGRGIAEAMFLGKPVIATAYSGNMDFMNENASFPVRYRLINLQEGDYPHWQDQVWADPDIEQAAYYMDKLVNDPEMGRNIGKRARQIIRKFGYHASGLRYLSRLRSI
ncbi:glycosyltransferase family 4 protein [Alicyclobacillus tolerans]|uniref:glycosyltransferase family 4 protein n=1 Tax=Alicyclobacillus tolerans TaxID=90970 RepID=UPI001F377DF1|nr:glycosyltransferase family 4 protein [Alicyclobacillus tolerans]MCF8567862.1 glycosyltransferase family 4 protein [Alicyclobacillus tolerans]